MFYYFWEDRAQLMLCVPNYKFEDWWSAASLDEEHRLAMFHLIPWDLRGPPNGPVANKPDKWRNLTWRPNSQKWMSRGGNFEEQRQRTAKYGKGGKSKTMDSQEWTAL